jgi:hypothetical protein
MTTIGKIPIITLLILFASAAFPQTSFIDTRAAKAFQAQNYEVALEEFNKLSQANPNNPLVLLYKALTMQMLGQYEKSIQVFSQALEISPENTAITYHLGVTYYLARQFDLANKVFQWIVENTSESKYAELGYQYLTAIRDELEMISKRQKVKAWSLYAQGGLAYDDNISALPDIPEYTNTNLGAGSGSGYLSLRGYFLRDKAEWLGTAEVSGFLTRYLEEDFESLDTGTYSGSLELQKTGITSKTPYLLEARYLYQHVDIDRDVPYSRSNIVMLSGKLFLQDRYSGKLAYSYTDDDFSYEGPDPQQTSRDANENRVVLTGSWFTPDGLKRLDIGGQYHDNSARGDNFDYTGYKIFLEGEIPLFWEIKGALKLSYGQDEYPNFQGPQNRETGIYDAQLRLTRWFGKRLFSSLDFVYHDETSNYKILSYDRNKLGLNVGYSY